MSRLLSTSLVAVGAIVISLSTGHAMEELVEVRLVDDVDQSRGYCPDIAGRRGTDAPLDKGLQAHTCYDYTGGLLEDQSFDATLIEQGQFRIPYFDVCMSVCLSQLLRRVLRFCWLPAKIRKHGSFPWNPMAI